MKFKLLIFLVLNFAALGIGGMFTNDGVTSDWYTGIMKAPWTPPGWVFGVAWTSIMICFTIYMAYLWERIENKRLLVGLFALQWILNVIWNPLFFTFHLVLPGLICIVGLTLLVGYFLYRFLSDMKLKSLLILPYFVWLLIATSLNAFILLNN